MTFHSGSDDRLLRKTHCTPWINVLHLVPEPTLDYTYPPPVCLAQICSLLASLLIMVSLIVAVAPNKPAFSTLCLHVAFLAPCYYSISRSLYREEVPTRKHEDRTSATEGVRDRKRRACAQVIKSAPETQNRQVICAYFLHVHHEREGA